MKNGIKRGGNRCNFLKRLPTGLLAFFIIIAAVVTWAGIRAAAYRIVIIGDSTAYTYTAADSLRGWGQELGLFFSPGAVTVINKAIGGRSSRSFVEDGHWASTLAILQKGDILLISFGTNDRGAVAERHADTAQFRQYLSQYVNESRAKGAIPVLISTVNQNSWNGTTFTEGFNTGVNDYHGAMLRVVDALSVPFIDLEQKSAALFKSLGESYLANFIFIAGNTHFQEMGAIAMAKLIAEGIKELADSSSVGELSTLLAPQYMITIASNKSDAGMITASGAYPQNAPITLKAMPKSDEVFKGWSDTSGKSLTAGERYSFTMKNAECSFHANFLGGTRINEKTTVGSSAGIAIHPIISQKTISVVSDAEIKSMEVCSPAGRTLKTVYPNCQRAVINLHALCAGVYFVSVHTLKDNAVRPISLGK